MEPGPPSWGSLCSPVQSYGPPDHQGSLKPAFTNDHWLTWVFHTFFLYLQSPSGRKGFPGDSDGKESACNAGDLGWEDPLEEGMAIHSSVLAWRIPMDKGAWQATVHGVTKSQAWQSLSTRTHRVGWNINHLLCPFTLFLPTRLNALYAVLYSCLLSWETEAQRWVGSAWGVSHLLGHTKRGLSLFSPGPLRWKPGKGTTAPPWGQCKICACSSHEIKRHLLLERKK